MLAIKTLTCDNESGREVLATPLSRPNPYRKGLAMKATHRMGIVPENYEIVESGCWEWRSRADANGYGKAYDPTAPSGKRVDWAHRISYRLHKGPIPHKHDIDHVCQNTICVNPDHLEAVTRVEHARRTMARLGYEELQTTAAILRVNGLTYAEIADVLGLSGLERAHQHVKSAIAKGLVDPDALPTVRHLSDEDYRDIPLLYAMGISQPELATFYEIDSSQVSRIVNGKRNGHVASFGRAP